MTNQDNPTGGDAVLEGWIAAFRGPLVGLIASWGADWRAAEELAQDTLAEAWVGRARFQGELQDLSAAGAWLRGIAFNLHRTAKRAQDRHRSRSIHETEVPAVEEAPSDERQGALAQAFEMLNAKHQSVLRMHYLEETSARQVAALLGTSPKAVESRLYQARKALRVELNRVQSMTTKEVR